MFNDERRNFLLPGLRHLLNMGLCLTERQLGILSNSLINAVLDTYDKDVEDAILDISRIIGSFDKCSLCTHQDTCKYEETLSSVNNKSEGKVKSHVVKCEHFKDKNSGGNQC